MKSVSLRRDQMPRGVPSSPEQVMANRRARRIENRARKAEYDKAYRLANRDKIKAGIDAWRVKNRKKIADRQRANTHKNRAKIRSYKREWCRRRYHSDPVYRAITCYRARVWAALRKSKTTKTQTAFALLGCTIPHFMDHIAAKFKGRMSWENYGRVWEIDHILPISFFDLTDAKQCATAFHYTNCQPLFMRINRSKGARVPQSHQFLLL